MTVGYFHIPFFSHNITPNHNFIIPQLGAFVYFLFLLIRFTNNSIPFFHFLQIQVDELYFSNKYASLPFIIPASFL